MCEGSSACKGYFEVRVSCIRYRFQSDGKGLMFCMNSVACAGSVMQ